MVFLGEMIDVDNTEQPDFSSVDLGYLEPGHGMKGKNQWLHSDDDVKEMYAKHVGRRNIQLWGYSHVKVFSKKEATSFEAHKKSFVEVDESYDELRTWIPVYPEQLRMWAHMVCLGKHESLDEPQDKPFWCGRKQPQIKNRKRRLLFQLLPAHLLSRFSVRSELLDQLSKWHKLSETGVVSDKEYEEFKMTDIKQL